MSAAPSYHALLIDTIDRYRFNFGQPPDRMRASRHFGAEVFREFQDAGAVIEHKGCGSHLQEHEFEYMGVIVKCDINTDVPTVLARYEPW